RSRASACEWDAVSSTMERASTPRRDDTDSAVLVVGHVESRRRRRLTVAVHHVDAFHVVPRHARVATSVRGWVGALRRERAAPAIAASGVVAPRLTRGHDAA